MNMEDAQLDGSNGSSVDILLRGKKLSDGDFKALTGSLHSRTARNLQKMASDMSTGSVRKNDRPVGMAKIGAIHRQYNNEAESEATLSISYITEEVKQVLQNLPEFSDVVQ